MNAYVGGGYGAVTGILGLYALYVRRRARTLSRAVDRMVVTPAGETAAAEEMAEEHRGA